MSKSQVRMIEPLTGLRAIAAAWVLLYHLRPAPPGLVLLFESGYLGVDVFAVLSGFVIMHNYGVALARWDPRGVGRYLALRLVRIVPLHWLGLAAMLFARWSVEGFATARAVERDDFALSDFVQSALLLHGWGLGNGFSWNVPSWTVSTEWLSYLTFPLLALVAGRARSAALCFALAAASLAATIAALHAVGRPGFHSGIDYGWIRIGGEFATGCWLQRAWAGGFARRLPWGAIAAAALAGVVACVVVAQSAAGVVACSALLVFALASGEASLVARGFGAAPLVQLGHASYAVYILQWPVIRSLEAMQGWPPTGPVGGAIPVAFASVVFVGLAAHFAIDLPVRERLRAWVAPRGAKEPRPAPRSAVG